LIYSETKYIQRLGKFPEGLDIGRYEGSPLR
jgi:hypothetical protein